MSSRDLILGRIRAALGDTPVPEVPRAYRPAGSAAADLDLLVDRLVDYKAVVHRGSDVAAVVAALGPGRIVVPPGIDRSWLPAGARVVEDEHDADAVLTAAAVAIAETGTIVLDGSADQGRRALSLLPDLHICVVRPDQVVATVPDGLARLDPARPLTWISGPSATSDIELNRVEGVHGPRNLHVVLPVSR
ncbi:LutC/YkgG family protein [Couchioplanes caeruleus]|uniref:Lactate utilization protein C n=2 Tax=Couchioplanes caeruleus TaxID=56438 RepID=A0A1K0FHA9_9ACTN|nr:lactate utilization protein C [Couchioplanes caeruleus]OJF12213.1 lactate utilization protein C [Couchioplanes caeruleus subsp. caeruleus]ROP30510.1 L-lactate dehydrogenase complex protein LldG [Couchioplanes caeruleus]